MFKNITIIPSIFIMYCQAEKTLKRLLLNADPSTKEGKKIIRKRMEEIKAPKIKSWYPVAEKDFSDRKTVKQDKFGGKYPFFSTIDTEWPKCERCGKNVSFLCQVSDPSDLNYFGTIQLFYCPNESKFSDSFLIKRIDYSDEYKRISKPRGVKAYKKLLITKWEKVYDFPEDFEIEELLEEYDDIVSDLLEDVYEFFYNEERYPYYKGGIGYRMKWYGKQPSNHSDAVYSPFSFKLSSLKDWKSPNDFTVVVQFKGEELVVKW